MALMKYEVIETKDIRIEERPFILQKVIRTMLLTGFFESSPATRKVKMWRYKNLYWKTFNYTANAYAKDFDELEDKIRVKLVLRELTK